MVQQGTLFFFTHNETVPKRNIAKVAYGDQKKKYTQNQICQLFLVSCKTQYNDRGNMAQTDQLFMLIMMASFQICTVPGSDFTKKVSLSFFSKI